ncbi:bacillopeptidase F (M6 metalloprotease family) [Bacillus pakistanensis]|uniref:Bacillopeptidase F (M6 metalloprotease family) n=1 Tax=Rossellomorea pakistanensis TaxID=992288 RepID=A0ABS2NB32_9BACI|nr:hypothetical protein [Bacillus pakistanensis]MBM7585057.1 bacillopeptidase F (M6 metalloprotease family) [Bacillus pakistanensis]
MNWKVLLPLFIVIVGIGFWIMYDSSVQSGEEVNKEKTKVENKVGQETSKGEINEEESVMKSIVNDEKLIEQLKEKGVIPKDATRGEIEEILKEYLRDKKIHPTTEDVKKKKEYINQLKEEIKNKGLNSIDGN